jgi:hypothetical protein
MTDVRRSRKIGKTRYNVHTVDHPGFRQKADPEWGRNEDQFYRILPKDRVGMRDVVKSNSKYSRVDDEGSVSPGYRKMMQKSEREKLEEKNFGKLHGYMIDRMADERELPDYRKQKTTRSKKPVTKKPVRKVAKKPVRKCKR